MRIIDSEGGSNALHREHVINPPLEKPSPSPASAPGKATQADGRSELTEDELAQLWAWNQAVPPPIQRCMHDIFVEQSQARPNAIALQSWDGDLTYAELDALSSQLAHDLVARGLPIGARVPLCFEKSKWAVVALLGVMKSGATFSLTDPSQPEARLQTIVEQTGAKLILTSSTHRVLGQKLSASDGQVLAISEEFFKSASISPELALEPLPNVPPSTPMYIIFTSGSTGKPKGVVISHENYTSGALPRAEAVGYSSTSRCFDFPSYAFDVSIDCMLCTLAMGGRVCIPSEEARMNDLSGAIRRSKANMVHMTPSVARVLDADIIPSLDVLGLGGEAVSSSDAAAWSQHTNLVIAYGPSECTVGCTINNTVTESTGIGKGVGGVTWIVDPEDHHRLMPIGEVGELIIEGPLVGIGYLDEPEKTAEVFVQDPRWLLTGFGLVPGRRGRLYKTGDLVRYETNNSGSIEFVGRKDQQVKIRGQRVELTEVEHHLQACLPQGVKVAAEVIKPDGGSPMLVAFVSESQPGLAPGSGNDLKKVVIEPSEELRSSLSSVDSTMGARVPRYMVPGVFITLRDMPSLVSRKLDRKKLREIALSIPREQLISSQSQDVDAGEEQPETWEEKLLEEVWKKVLPRITALTRQSNFFHHGGDSLRAMKLIAAAREQGLGLTVADVFKHPSLAGMASKASRLSDVAQDQILPFSLLQDNWDPDQARREASSLCNIDADAVEDMYPCTPLQEALMALSAKVKEAYVAQRVVELGGLADAEKLVAAFGMAEEDCPILRTRIIQASGRGLVQVVVKGDVQWHSGSRLDQYLRTDRDDAMDLGRPLIRYAIINEPQHGKVYFVLTMHHALYDGFSMPLVVERVNKTYQGQALTRPAGFKHFIKHLVSQERGDSETFWRGRLEGASGPQFPSLPFQGYQTQADSLLELSVPLAKLPASNVTVATVIRAAWAIVASQYIDTTDVVFGETLTGRNTPIVGVEEIEGPMITTVPVRIQVDHNSSVEEYLQEVQEQTVLQIPHEHFGLQHIRRLSPDALEACELRTGLVLHPSTEGQGQPDPDELPASRLVPAGDNEAAQEALKFNTYALMLVCSIDPKGFFIMASFDSKTVSRSVMEQVLEQLKAVSQQLCENTTSSVGEVSTLTDSDLSKLTELHQQEVPAEIVDQFPGTEDVYVVNSEDPRRRVPLGGTGQLIIRSSEKLNLPEIYAPALKIEPRGGFFYKTSRVAGYDATGKLIFPEKPTARSTGPASQASKQPRLSATSRKQRKLRELWSKVLRIPEQEIGLNDSFFHLGGDSISAMKLVSEARLAGLILTVVQIFSNRSLYDIAKVMIEGQVEGPGSTPSQDAEVLPPFALVGEAQDTSSFIENVVRPQLANPAWEVTNILPTRPLQQIAVQGTTQIPRFSARYELIYFDGAINRQRLLQSCHDLVAKNEILRTVFIERDEQAGYGVVLKDLEALVVEYEIDGDVEAFAKQLCHLDVLTKMPLGSSFVKFFLIQGNNDRSCLIFRISHAQYDEICLPLMLRQLSALYQGKPMRETIPFSSFVGHVLRKAIPGSVEYWRDLLKDSSMTVLKPDIPVLESSHFAIERTVDISSRGRETTVATLPTAAWALCLAKRLSLRDVTFGEVVSGRNIDFPHADAVAGPCWQYIPVRVKFDPRWTALDLLDHVQHQHIARSAHECMGLREIAETCTDWSPSSAEWFDSVVHQDVEHVESLGLAGSVQGGKTTTHTRMETLYVHEEPLREWKIQAFVRGEQLTLEIVTVRSWSGFAEQLLNDLIQLVEILVHQPHEMLFDQ